MGEGQQDHLSRSIEAEVSPPERRIRPWLALGTLALVIVLFTLIFVWLPRFQDRTQRARVESSAAVLRERLARDYPDWTVERTWTEDIDRDHGGPLLLVAVLRWAGPQDFRIALRVPVRRDDGELGSVPMTLFRNRQDAVAFIDAFAVRHPEPGYVVEAGSLGLDLVQSPRPEDTYRYGSTEYWVMTTDTSNGRRRLYDWRITTTPDGIMWSALD